MLDFVNGEHPPNFEAILAKFPGASGPHVVFAYGDKIYNPSGLDLPHELIAHEAVHCERQLEMGVDLWWEKYIDDPEFMYQEELLAHVAEYKEIVSKYNYERHAIGRVKERALEHVAKKLSAPLYNGKVSFHQAKAAIRRAARGEQ